MARRAAASTASVGVSTRVCVLCGGDEMTKREHLDRLREALRAEHGEIETVSFDGKAAALADVLDELRGFSLMGAFKLVIVDDADAFVSAHRDALERYAAAPVDHAALVLRSGRWYPGKLDKLIDKVGCVVKCEPRGPAEVQAWLVERASKNHARKLDPRAAALLAERLGSDLMFLDNELAKLALLTAVDEPITPALVEQAVGRSSEEEAYAVQEAVLEALSASPRGGAGGTATAAPVLAKVHELVDLSGQPETQVAYFVADLIRKLYLGLMMRREGVPDGQIARELKLWGPRQFAFMRVLGRLKPDAAARLFDRVVDLDVRSKSGRGEPLRNLECFCSGLADEMR